MVERKAKTRSGRLLIRLSAGLVVAYLVYFHALLFWQRVISDSLFKPAVAIRWLATGVLVTVMVRLLRAGVPLLRGRNAAGFWLVVLLLHGSFWAPLSGDVTLTSAESPMEFILAVPAVLTVAAVVVIAVLSRHRQKTRNERSPLQPLRRGDLQFETHPFRSGILPILACRPPPTV